MSLTTATRLGPYEILAPLGAGGMGEVYKGRDSRLDRTVAIKILTGDLAGDPQFRDRFNREAKAISSLNHPNICTLYDVGEAASPLPQAGGPSSSLRYLVLEYLEGESLATRLEKGPLPLPDALRIGLDILNALEAAHRHGIVHRDLKPGNVMLTKTGAKLLDFGLAKTTPLGTSINPVAPTLTAGTAPLTARGTILGTFQYMAPEQLEGADADARTDLFAFGAMLYEMITGRRAFSGKTQASLVGAILKEDPPPVSQTQAVAPPALEHLVRTCLAKDPDARYQTAHDVKIQLSWIAQGGSAVGVPAPIAAKRRTREAAAWSAAAVLGAVAVAGGTLAFVHLRETPPWAERVEFAVSPSANQGIAIGTHFAVSPDGRSIVYTTAPISRERALSIRSLGSQTARPLPGTEGAGFPFWSADGRSLGFFAGGKLRKIDLSAGTSIPLCDVGAPPGGGTWNRDNVIVFSPSPSGALHKVDAAGGACTPLTTLGEGEIGHQAPWFLPDGRRLLYLALRRDGNQLLVASLDAAASTSIGASESSAVYASGHLLLARSGALMAQPFDADTLRTFGDSRVVNSDVFVGGNGRVGVGASTTGILAYSRGNATQISRLTWTDRTGASLGVVGEPGTYSNVNLSGDGKRLTVSRTTGTPANRDIWIIDLTRADVASRRTFNAAVEADPAFSPDGGQIVYNSNRNRTLYNTLYLTSAEGGGQETELYRMERLMDSPEWSHDGKTIAYTGGSDGSSSDIMMLPLTGDRKPRPLFESTFSEDSPAFSPDDRWIAYNSDPSGRQEVYVRDASGSREVQISRDGGWAPRWRGDGKEIFFLGLDGKMMAVDIGMGTRIEAGVPRALFSTSLRRVFDRRTYAVTLDGNRFLFPVPVENQAIIPLTVIVNWLSEPNGQR